MHCPRCGHHERPARYTCPHCRSAFDAQHVEALDRLDYLRLRVADWRSLGLLPAGVAQRLLDEAERERDGLQRALGSGAHESARGPAAAPARVAVPPPAPAAPAAPVVAAPAAPAGRPAPWASGAAWLPRVDSPKVAAPAAPVTSQAPRAPETPLPPSPAGGGARGAGRGFSWAELGRSLLSERTLHALLGLGAFLILTSGVVISVLNPTGLGPLLHLAAVLATALLFCGAGWVVRQRLGLALTGTALLAIGAAFVPLAIWTLGQRRLLGWSPSTVWLVASAVCLPLYGGAYAFLRERTFAFLTALAGGSLVLASTYGAGIPLEWGLCAVLLLAMAYLELAGRTRRRWPEMRQALFLTAQAATVLILAGLLGAQFAPRAVLAGRGEGADPYAVGAAWWLGTAFYALAARRAAGRAARRWRRGPRAR
ncbi:MAG TPA: hypothetical protein VHQ00_04740, partial [Chloroflexota bacterium]|nr:hypothetical protein [Chloroflexota bacterium]